MEELHQTEMVKGNDSDGQHHPGGLNLNVAPWRSLYGNTVQIFKYGDIKRHGRKGTLGLGYDYGSKEKHNHNHMLQTL